MNHSLHRLNKDQILNVPFTNLTDLVTSTSPSNGQQTLIIVIFIFITSKLVFLGISPRFSHVCPTFFRTSFRCRRDLRSFRVHRELLLSQLRSDSEASADFTIDLGEARWGFLTLTFGILWEHIWEQIWKTSGESAQIFYFPKLHDVFFFSGKHMGKHIGKLYGKYV